MPCMIYLYMDNKKKYYELVTNVSYIIITYK